MKNMVTVEKQPEFQTMLFLFLNSYKIYDN